MDATTKTARPRTELVLDLIGRRPAACGADQALLQVVGVEGPRRPGVLRARHVLQGTTVTRSTKLTHQSTHPAVVMRRVEKRRTGHIATTVMCRPDKADKLSASAQQSNGIQSFAYAQRPLSDNTRSHLHQRRRSHLLLPPPAAHQEEGAQGKGHGGGEGDADDEPSPPRELISRWRLPCAPDDTLASESTARIYTLKGASAAMHDRASYIAVHTLPYAHSSRGKSASEQMKQMHAERGQRYWVPVLCTSHAAPMRAH